MMVMQYTTLIDTAALADELANPSLAIVDCRADLRDYAWGAREYEARHIPGAVPADLERDLSGEKTGTNGRHPLPRASDLAATFSRLGIDDEGQVVAYDQDTGMYASRLWWLLRWLGHDRVAVLDGGFAKWLAEGRATAAGTETRTWRPFTPRPAPGMVVDVDDVAAAIGSRDWTLVDARAPERFRGDTEPLDRAPGHIPGAINHHFKSNLGEGGTFLPPDVLRARFRQMLGTAADRVISYCGSGVTACHNLLALEHAGLPGGKLYPGSWSEWSSDPARAVGTGDSGL